MKLNSKSGGAVAFVAAFVLATTACADKPGDKSDADGLTATSAVGGGASMSYTVPQLLDSMDIAEDHGLNLDYQGSGTSSTNMLAAVMSGEVDFAFPAATTALNGINEGSDIVIVAGALESASILALTNKAAEDAGVASDAPIKERIGALKGLSIVTSPEGSGNNLMLRMILGAAGLNPDKDVKIVGVQDPSAIVGGVKQGRFDAGFYGSGVLEANIAADEAELWVSTARGDVDSLLGVQVGMVMVTKRSTLEEDPDLVRSMFDSVVDVEGRIEQDPEEVGENLKENWFEELDDKIFDLSWEQAQKAYPSEGLVPEKGLNSLISLMERAMDSKLDIDYSKVVYEPAQEPS